MAKYGPFFTYWSKDWESDFFDVIKKCAKAGGNCMELHCWVIENWPDHKLKDFKKAYEDLGIELAYWCGFSPETNVISADPAVREAAVKHIIKYIKFTEKMGARILDGTYIQPWNIDLAGRDREEAMDTSVECFRKMADVAEDSGVMLSMEILNRFEGVMVNTMHEAVEALDRIQSPNVSITADSFHMNIEEDGIKGAILEGAKYIKHFHLGEANRKLPGNGTQINWNELFGTLKKIKYNGMFIFEGFVLHNGEVAKDVKLYRDLSGNATQEEMTEALAKSLKFVKGKFGEKKSS